MPDLDATALAREHIWWVVRALDDGRLWARSNTPSPIGWGTVHVLADDEASLHERLRGAAQSVFLSRVDPQWVWDIAETPMPELAPIGCAGAALHEIGST